MINNEKQYTLPIDVAKWYSKPGIEFFQNVNLQENQVVLDFGSRVGNYTIPAAMVVGPLGKVYAVDIDFDALDILDFRAKKFNLENIITIRSSGELILNIPDNSIDFILFYDVIYPICKTRGIEAYLDILDEFIRVLRQDGIFTILIDHIDKLGFTVEDILEMTKEKITFAGEYTADIMHWDTLQKGTIYIFNKEG